LLDLFEEPFDQVARGMQIRAEQIGSLRFRFGGMFAHAPLLAGKPPDPVGIGASNAMICFRFRRNNGLCRPIAGSPV
jgi:hypothetical protein